MMNNNNKYKKIVIPQSLLLYCFKADSYYDYNRRVYILSKYIIKQYDKTVEKALISSIYGICAKGGLL